MAITVFGVDTKPFGKEHLHRCHFCTYETVDNSGKVGLTMDGNRTYRCNLGKECPTAVPEAYNHMIQNPVITREDEESQLEDKARLSCEEEKR